MTREEKIQVEKYKYFGSIVMEDWKCEIEYKA